VASLAFVEEGGVWSGFAEMLASDEQQECERLLPAPRIDKPPRERCTISGLCARWRG
jgi:hypothetical protein